MSLADFIGSPDVAGWLADLARQIRERVERWPGPGDGPGDDDPELRCVLELADGGWGVYGVGALSVGVEPTPRPALYLDPAWLVRDLRRLDLGVPWVEVERAETLGPPVSWQGTDGFLTAGHVTGAKGTSVTVMDPTRARLPASVVEQVLPGAFPPPPGSPVGDLDVAIVTIGGTTPSALGLGGPGTAKPKDPATKTRGAGVANSTTGEINSFSP